MLIAGPGFGQLMNKESQWVGVLITWFTLTWFPLTQQVSGTNPRTRHYAMWCLQIGPKSSRDEGGNGERCSVEISHLCPMWWYRNNILLATHQPEDSNTHQILSFPNTFMLRLLFVLSVKLKRQQAQQLLISLSWKLKTKPETNPPKKQNINKTKKNTPQTNKTKT